MANLPIIAVNMDLQRKNTFKGPLLITILQSYVDICVNGCLEYGLDFLRRFVHTTGNWSRYWLNDRIIARRAWTHEKNYNIIDKYITKFLKEKNINFKCLLSEDYVSIKIKKSCLIKPKLLQKKPGSY